MKDRHRLERVDEVFAKELKAIGARNAPVSGYMPGTRRITKAIRRHSLWEKIKEDIILTPLEDDTK